MLKSEILLMQNLRYVANAVSFEMRRRSYQIQGKVHIYWEDDAFIHFTTKHKLSMIQTEY